MAVSASHMRLLRLFRILSEETDEAHGLTLKELSDRLSVFGISGERKTLYDDFAALEAFGCEIQKTRDGRDFRYSLLTRTFELPELKLLVDLVQSSRFITDKKSMQLIRKLETLTSRHEASALNRQMLLTGRVKSDNESIYYNVDALQEAIARDRQITFQYSNWNLQGVRVPRHDGQWYIVSPWALVWDNENYYLVATQNGSVGFRHYRIDKMMRISELDTPREGTFTPEDAAVYTGGSIFGMFTGKEIDVTLRCRNELVGVMFDRFGRGLFVVPEKDGEHFRFTVRVHDSSHFRGWLVSIGAGLEVLSPESVVDEMREETRRLFELYH